MATSFYELYRQLKAKQLEEDEGGAAGPPANNMGSGAIATFDPLLTPKPMRRKKPLDLSKTEDCTVAEQFLTFLEFNKSETKLLADAENNPEKTVTVTAQIHKGKLKNVRKTNAFQKLLQKGYLRQRP
jgi:hypothetical protein